MTTLKEVCIFIGEYTLKVKLHMGHKLNVGANKTVEQWKLSQEDF